MQEDSIHGRMTALEGRIDGSVNALGQRLDGTARALTDWKKDVDAVLVEQRAMLLRLGELESNMDNLPSRVSNLEKYGSDVTIRLPEQIREHADRLKVLEDKPKKKRKAEQRRMNRILMWVGVGGCLYSVLQIMLTIVGVVISVWLAHQ